MCLSGPSEACNNFVPNEAWMERSGNVCWGMGADAYIPCVNCGQNAIYHRMRAEYDSGALIEDDDT